MLNDDFNEMMRDYFAWSKVESPDDIGYPHSDPVRRLLGGSVRSIGLTDDEAICIDRAIAHLRSQRPQVFNTVKRIHQDGKSRRWMYENGEGDRRTIARMAESGEEFIRGCLFWQKVVGK